MKQSCRFGNGVVAGRSRHRNNKYEKNMKILIKKQKK
jgi:hypothetical protein